jgi:uncharacterized protein YdaU (DUF1376 family)
LDGDDPDITLPWIKLEIARWQIETLGLDAEMKGIFMDLMMYQWVKGPLPADDMKAMERIQPACVKRWQETQDLLTNGEFPWLKQLAKSQKAVHLSRGRGGKMRAAQAAQERKQTDNGERDDG